MKWVKRVKRVVVMSSVEGERAISAAKTIAAGM